MRREAGQASIGTGWSSCVSGSLKGDAGHASTAVRLLGLDAIADGGFAEAEAVIDGATESLVLHREGDQVRAWLNICPHAGRRLDWAPGQFLRSREGLLVCAAHGAGFEPRHGECVSGPCKGQSLSAVGVSVRDGAVWLSTAG